ATFGHLEVVKFLNENRTEGCTKLALQGAVRKGYVKVVEHLLGHGEEYITEIFIIAEYYRIQCHRSVHKKDYVGVLRCLSSHRGAVIKDGIILVAIKVTPLPALQFVVKREIHGITKRIFDEIIQIGDKDAIRYALEAILTENNKPLSLLDTDEAVDPWIPLDNADYPARSVWGNNEWSHSKAMDIAAVLGDLDTVKLLHRTGIQCCTVGAMNDAAAVGRLDILEWLHTHRTEGCTDDAMTYAIAGDHYDIVKWLHEVCGLNCTKDGLSSAAYNGNIDMVKYLISIPMIPEIVDPDDILRGGGNLSVGAPGNAPSINVFCGIAIDQAATNGHIDIVQLLKDYPATTNAMDRAAYNGHLDMIKYLHTKRSEGCTANAYSGALRTNRLDILKYLVTNKCYQGTIDFKKFCYDAAGQNNIDLVEYCLNQLQGNFTQNLKQSMMYKAAMTGLLDIVKWLHEVKGFASTSMIREIADTRGHKNVLRYLTTIGDCEESVLDSRGVWALFW
ncbi:hypothetical protein THRCLA_05273, partial [Thraustotheca clavata]